ncbi:NIPSNAP family protein [Nonomuraea terrae]|uniref:NIPSNAP family protein n=1 Tax=Nonomuraea terrae TaxID=2530383 RepID=UPI001CB73D78
MKWHRGQNDGHLRYEIDPRQIAAFEKYVTGWIPIVTRFGGTHHGCYLPHEGANDIAYALFHFPVSRPTRNTVPPSGPNSRLRSCGSSARRPIASAVSIGPFSARRPAGQRQSTASCSPGVTLVLTR